MSRPKGVYCARTKRVPGRRGAIAGPRRWRSGAIGRRRCRGGRRAASCSGKARLLLLLLRIEAGRRLRRVWGDVREAGGALVLCLGRLRAKTGVHHQLSERQSSHALCVQGGDADSLSMLQTLVSTAT